MKSLIFCLICFCTVTASAQTRKVFLADDGGETDATKATTYVTIERLSDTAWLAKQYGLDDTIMTVGTYKDAALSVMHGRFDYFKRDLPLNANDHPKNRLSLSGQFIDGKKTGQWLEYNYDGQLGSLLTYRDDKLNGLYEQYGGKSLPITIRGYYVDDLKENEWYTLSASGEITRTEIFKNGKLIKTTHSRSKLNNAVPANFLGEYLLGKVKHLVTADTDMRLIFSCVINIDGKMTDAKLFSPLSANKNLISDRFIEAMANAPLWKPASVIDPGKKVDERVTFTLMIAKGDLTLNYSLAAGQLSYNLLN